jgi:hypothetical protein
MENEKPIVFCILCNCEKRYKSKNPYPCPERKTHDWRFKKNKENRDIQYCDDRFCPNDGNNFGGGIKGYCHKYNKPKNEVKYCYKTFKGGWVTPEGELIPSSFGAHDASARDIIREKYPVLYDRCRSFEYKAEKTRKDFLVSKNWILLTGNPYPAMGFTDHIFIVCKKQERVTPQQHTLIKELQESGIRFSGFVEVEDDD